MTLHTVKLCIALTGLFVVSACSKSKESVAPDAAPPAVENASTQDEPELEDAESASEQAGELSELPDAVEETTATSETASMTSTSEPESNTDPLEATIMVRRPSRS